jgi:hypothetical protein
MKKLITLIIFAFACVAMFAQDRVITPNEPLKGIFYSSPSRKVAAFNYVFKVNHLNAYVYSYSVKLKDTSKTPTNQATFVIAGSLNNVDYKTITSVTYESAGADTTIIGNITSSPLSYPYIRFTITPNDTIWVESMHLNAVPLN